jgi:hypothetical protein
VLRMAAGELGDPVLFQVLAKTDDALLAHGDSSGQVTAGGHEHCTVALSCEARPERSAQGRVAPGAGMRSLSAGCLARLIWLLTPPAALLALWTRSRRVMACERKPRRSQ